MTVGEKADQVEVNYRPAKRERRCGSCTAFDPEPGACARVGGEIHPNMVCDLWTPLKRSHPGRGNAEC